MHISSSISQSIVWEGFIFIPKTDNYKIFTHTKNLNVTVYLDHQIVYDKSTNTSFKKQLYQNIAYKIKIIASSRALANEIANGYKSNIEFELMWQTDTIYKSLIPSYYLYDSSSDLLFTPFSVEVDN